MSYDNYSTQGVICPYCNHLNRADGDNYELFREETCDWVCDVCDKEFLVSVFIQHSWTTAPTTEAGQ